MESQGEVAYSEALNSIMIRSGRPHRIVTDPGSQLKSFSEKQKVAESQGIYEDFINTINEDIVDTVTKQLAKLEVEFCTTIPKAS